MNIRLQEIPIREVVAGYQDDQEGGVVGYGGKLNVRPAYQREFVYDDKKRNAVMSSVKNGFPLNVMYWAINNDGSYELLDGQQRTISICRYIDGEWGYEHEGHLFDGLTDTEREKILNYKLMIYICEGTDKEKLDWFKIINIASEPLTAQELRNAIYTGEWLTSAKKYFSKSNCPAYGIGKTYLKGEMDRQAYLETAIKWIANKEGKSIESYMAEHQNKSNASELWLYFESVISWVKTLFPTYRKEMQGIEWGFLYNQYKDQHYNPSQLEKEVAELMQDPDVTNRKGIYQYLLSGEERHLNIRAFDIQMKRAAYERQQGICVKCHNHFKLEEMHADHITPWHLGGKTVEENCQMLCADCNRRKSGI